MANDFIPVFIRGETSKCGRVDEECARNHETCAQVPALPLTSCVTLDKSQNEDLK